MRRSTCNRLSGVSLHLNLQASVPAFIASAFVKPRATMAPAEAKRQMAEDMRQAGQREGGVTRDDLSRMGWTSEQIDTLAAAANIRAQQLAGATL